MPQRQIIRIDEEKCTGCGECIPNCPEGALQIIDGKARLVSDLFCDGLGACIGHCPEGAITVEEREAEHYDERRVMANVVEGGPNVIRAHLEHLADHGQTDYLRQAYAYLQKHGIDVPAAPSRPMPDLGGGCPGSQVREFEAAAEEQPAGRAVSRLRQWPVQITLVPPQAPYLKGADLVITADCVPFAYGNFHEDFLKGKAVLVGCPKLDDVGYYREKLAAVFEQAEPASIEVVHMEVPCCFGLVHVVEQALADADREIPTTAAKISIQGEILQREPLAATAAQ
ncbi:MAG: ATP-binding protein [Planctomycetota bacterium]